MGLKAKAPKQNVSEIYVFSVSRATILGYSTIISNYDDYLQWPPNRSPCVNTCPTPGWFLHTQWPW